MADLVSRLRRTSCQEHGTDWQLGTDCVACMVGSENHEAAERIEELEREKEAIIQITYDGRSESAEDWTLEQWRNYMADQIRAASPTALEGGRNE